MTGVAMFFPPVQSLGADLLAAGVLPLLREAGAELEAVVLPPGVTDYPLTGGDRVRLETTHADALTRDAYVEYSRHPERLFQHYGLGEVAAVVVAPLESVPDRKPWGRWSELAAIAAKATGRKLIVLPTGGEGAPAAYVSLADGIAAEDERTVRWFTPFQVPMPVLLGPAAWAPASRPPDGVLRMVIALHRPQDRSARLTDHRLTRELDLGVKICRALAADDRGWEVTLVAEQPASDDINESLLRRLTETVGERVRLGVVSSSTSSSERLDAVSSSHALVCTNAQLATFGAAHGLPTLVTAPSRGARTPRGVEPDGAETWVADVIERKDRARRLAEETAQVRSSTVDWLRGVLSAPVRDTRDDARRSLRRLAREGRSDLQEFGSHKTEPSPSVAEVRDGVRAIGIAPYAMPQSPRRDSPEKLGTEGWSLGGFDPVVVATDLDWFGAAMSNRTWGFRLHAWEFLQGMMGDPTSIFARSDVAWGATIARSWGGAFESGDPRGTQARYDMSIALRAMRLTWLTAFHLLEYPNRESDNRRLLDLLELHREWLLDERAFTARTNHGVFSAIAGLALARQFPMLPGMNQLGGVSRARLSEVTRGQFHPDGGHSEHSADYHRMMLDTYAHALRIGLIADGSLRALLERAEYVLGWLIQPNGELVQIGDSPAHQMRGSVAGVTDGRTRFHLTGGTGGSVDDRTILVLPDTGWAFVRDPQPAIGARHEDSSYLSLAAAFHSRTHKHADDLSVTWYDRGDEVLVDAGRFGYGPQLPPGSPLSRLGYFYADEERQYIEATRAHNTLEADGRDQERRDREPYGSALAKCVESNAHYFLSGVVNHEHWTHHRSLVLAPGSWLYVLDNAEALDGNAHTFRAWWNLSDVWKPTPVAKSDLVRWAFRREIDGLALWVVDASGAAGGPPASGQMNPMRGWRSKVDRSLVPTWSIALEKRSRAHTFETLFVFASDQPSVAELRRILRRASREAAGAQSQTFDRASG